MWQKFIGKCSNPTRNHVTVDAIEQFAKAIGHTSPIYVNESEAKNYPHGRMIAPSTFPRSFNYGEISGFNLPKSGLIHGEQSYDYRRPIYAGDILYCQFQLASLEEKRSREGLMLVIQLFQWGNDQNKTTIFQATRTLIMRGSLLKEYKENGITANTN